MPALRIWDGTAWQYAAANASPVAVQATAPASPFVGQEWLDTSDPGVVPVGPWTSYTPIWRTAGTAPSVGNGSLTGKYVLLGKTCHFRIRLLMGSTTAYGSSWWIFTLPFVIAGGSEEAFAGSAMVLKYQVGYQSLPLLSSLSNNNEVTPLSSGGALTSQGTPVTFAANDKLSLAGTYEVL